MAEKIYAAINAVMSEVGAIRKESKNKSQGFLYRGIDDVMNALNPSFIKNKIFTVPEVMDQRREERKTSNGGNLIYSICKVQFTFYADDGSSVKAITVGEGMDSGDKATNKAMSIAFKYACFQLFCIPTEEMEAGDSRPVDPDGESHKVIGKRGQTLTEKQINEIYNECHRTGVGWKNVCNAYCVQSLSGLTPIQYKDAVKQLRERPDDPRKKKSENPTDETADPGLPWNTPPG